MVTFNPKQVTEKFLFELSDRSRDIIAQRYGLRGVAKKSTLDAIGKKYGITRERVRQIENYSLEHIRKSSTFGDSSDFFNELARLIESAGGVVAEDNLLSQLSKNSLTQNYFYLLLVLGEPFIREKEDLEFKTRWFVNRKLSEDVAAVLKDISQEFDKNILMTENDILSLFHKKAKERQIEMKNNNENIKRWLVLSKTLGKNPFDEWGLSTSPNIKTRGIRSYSYLVVRQNGSPMHFKEVARMIRKHFNKKAHIATCHNELIKDDRFVLVGRGLYALSEWGYTQGIVKDVIRDILKKRGPLTKEKIVDLVLKERYVKGNTVLVNLQNSDLFKKNSAGAYTVC